MKKIIFILFCSILSININSQSNKFNPQNLTFGGDLGLQFGDYTTVNISPQVGYNFNKYLNAGAGIGYTYYKDTYYYGSDEFKSSRSYFGLNIYSRFYPTDFLVVMVQPEANRMWSTIKSERSSYKYSESKFVPSVLVGAGARLGPMLAMLQYDVVQDKNSPYGNRLFYSIGYVFQF